MSWIEKLYQTYDNCSGYIGKKEDKEPLLPVCHTTQNAQIEIVIDGEGEFKRAFVIPLEDAKTIIPCTEESGGRTGSKPVGHPLCDKLQYLAGDFLHFGGTVTSGFANNPKHPYEAYVKALSNWCESEHRHPKVVAVHKYVLKETLITDLCKEGVLFQDATTGSLTKKWDEKLGIKSSPENAFVRWVVEISEDPQTELWNDKTVWKSWIDYFHSLKTLSKKGICYVTGTSTLLAKQHPAKIRNSGDKAKLISSNDSSGFTYRGRFNDDEQACGISFSISQKAHNVLRWLIARQGYKEGSLAIVAWELFGKNIPDPLVDSHSLLSECVEKSVAQSFALRLKKKMRGYKEELGDSANIVIIAMDSATNGRMSLLYYQELSSSEFLDRLEAWHEQCCWHQSYDNKIHFLGAPSPKDIAETAYDSNINGKLKNQIIRQLLSCIIENSLLPRNLLDNCFRRVCNRISFKKKQHWEKALGITCALYKYTYKKRDYKMALEKDRVSRDYLYGRLLALAERLEEIALRLCNEKRPTNAARLMQNFADHPYATWRTLELQLQPYKNRLKNSREAFLRKIEAEIDSIMALFKLEEFVSKEKLSGEFLLGYHCQRAELEYKHNPSDSKKTDEEAFEDSELLN